MSSKQPPIPPWLNQVAIVAAIAGLLFNLVADVFGPSDYNGQTITLALIAFLSLCLGYKKTLRGDDE